MDERYEIRIGVEEADIDELGHVNNVVYVRWVQEAAVAHWRAAAPDGEAARLFWIVLRHEIDYKQSALLGDEVIAATWVGNATRLKFERHTEITRARDGALLAKALTVWCPMEAATGRPAAVSAEVRAIFSRQTPHTR